ncbi:Uncharacterized protein Adt_18079 [Abeliophyllum distichum]|uniref:Uncharacterized protein n=1 Tax=Abeliophyllum distichum TaxID=126358 RepID=A0ABD1TID0_9LAMI
MGKIQATALKVSKSWFFFSSSESFLLLWFSSKQSRSSLDFATGGSIQNRSAVDLYDIFETMSEQFVMWLERGLQKKATGIHEVDTNSLVLAKLDALAKQMEAMKYSHSANMVQMSPPICVTCGVNYQSS